MNESRATDASILPLLKLLEGAVDTASFSVVEKSKRFADQPLRLLRQYRHPKNS